MSDDVADAGSHMCWTLVPRQGLWDLFLQGVALECSLYIVHGALMNVLWFIYNVRSDVI